MDSQLLGENTLNALQDLLKMPNEESDSDDDFKVCCRGVFNGGGPCAWPPFEAEKITKRATRECKCRERGQFDIVYFK